MAPDQQIIEGAAGQIGREVAPVKDGGGLEQRGEAFPHSAAEEEKGKEVGRAVEAIRQAGAGQQQVGKAQNEEAGQNIVSVPGQKAAERSGGAGQKGLAQKIEEGGEDRRQGIGGGFPGAYRMDSSRTAAKMPTMTAATVPPKPRPCFSSSGSTGRGVSWAERRPSSVSPRSRTSLTTALG